MSRDANGTHTLPLSPVVTDTTITSTWANTTMSDLSVALSDSLSRSGKGGLTASIPSDVGCTGTVNPEGDTAAADSAAVGYNATDGIVITGQGSNNDVTIKNDAAADVIEIPTGTTNVDIVGVATAASFEPDGDTASGDSAAIGYTAIEGIVITGQGSTSDVTIKNDADTEVMSVPTGTISPIFAGDIVLNERADHASTVGAAKGYLWLKNDTPNALIFTDDAGTDYNLSTIVAGDITVADESSDTTCFPVFTTAATGTLSPKTDTSNFTYDSSIGELGITSILFPDSQTDSADVNSLDDYEEGSWTPTVHDAQSGGNAATVASETGNYTKIGNRVMCQGTFTLSSISGMTSGNQVWVRGLPFSSQDNAAGTLSEASALTGMTGIPIGITNQTATSVMSVVKFSINGGNTAFLVSNLTNSSFMRFGVQYMLDV